MVMKGSEEFFIKLICVQNAYDSYIRMWDSHAILKIYMIFTVWFTWNWMFGWQLGPEKESGLTRNTNPDGTNNVDASTLQAASNAWLVTS